MLLLIHPFTHTELPCKALVTPTHHQQLRLQHLAQAHSDDEEKEPGIRLPVYSWWMTALPSQPQVPHLNK